MRWSSLVADSPRQADARAAQQPSHGRAADETFVARRKRSGDAVAPRLATAALTAETVEAAEPGAAIHAVRAPCTRGRAGHEISTANPAETLARWHAGSAPSGLVRVVRAADQTRDTGIRLAGPATTAILSTGQDLRIRLVSAKSGGCQRSGRQCAAKPGQRAAARLLLRELPGQRIESVLLHNVLPSFRHGTAPVRRIPDRIMPRPIAHAPGTPTSPGSSGR